MADSTQADAERFMRRALQLAEDAVTSGKGRPFGAVIVRDGRIVAEGHNEVLHRTDPTAHAEIVVIGRATHALGTLDLSGCALYVNATPCPMCATALRWCRMGHIYHALSASDAAGEGFDDSELFVDVAKPVGERVIPVQQLPALREEARKAFGLWREAQGAS